MGMNRRHLYLTITMVLCTALIIWLVMINRRHTPTTTVKTQAALAGSVRLAEATTTTSEPPRPTTTHASRSESHRANIARFAECGGDVWCALATCESHRNTAAVGGGGRYFGAFQFSLSTWHSLGMSGNPVDYTYEQQRDAAIRLVARSGWGQFPVCGRRVN